MVNSIKENSTQKEDLENRNIPGIGQIENTIWAILFIAFITQMAMAIQSVGYFHPDQHFQIIEFAMNKLGIATDERQTWEFFNHVRPTLQVYIYLGYFKIMQFLHMDYAYTSDMVLRILISSLGFLLYNYIIIREFRNDQKSTLYIVLIIANFSWFLPYVNTLFSSEILGGLIYFSTVLLFLHFKRTGLNFFKCFLTGLLMCMAFYFRFQMAFAMIGFAIWVVFIEKESYKIWIGIIAGFLLGAVFNTWLDSQFYGEFVVTPYTYYYVNIIEGQASYTGTSSFIFYMLILAATFTAPILSIILLFYLFKGLRYSLNNVYSLSVGVFLLIHFLIPHKEDRFLFPLFGILPIILGYGLRDITNKLPAKFWQTGYSVFFKAAIVFSVVFNVILLLLMFQIPISRSVHFTKKLNDFFDDGEKAKIIFHDRTPFETPGMRNFHSYYYHSVHDNIEIEVIDDPDAFLKKLNNPNDNEYFSAAYHHAINDQKIFDMGCTPVLVTSKPILALNKWLDKKGFGTIDDIWILYECGQQGALKPLK